MENETKFNAVLLKKELGHGRHHWLVVDTDTGEIMMEKHTGSFADGANAFIKEAVFSREIPGNGSECIYVTVEDGGTEINGCFWHNGRQRKQGQQPRGTGGKPAYLRLYVEQLRQSIPGMSDADIGALIRMAVCCDWQTGALVDSKTKKPLDFQGLLNVTGYNRATLSRRMEALRKHKVLQSDNGQYVLSREVVAKGVR